MPDTLLSLALTIAFVLPGFVIADLAESRRATRAARSDLELVLRGLVYALILQGLVALTGWTGEIVGDLNTDGGWENHLGALAVFGLVVAVLIPTGLGLILSAWLRAAEQRGQLRPWHYALGGRDHRHSWASQARTRPQEIYVEEVWPADANGMVDEDVLERIPTRGMWISTEKIDRLEILHLSDLVAD